jgi:putative transposase
MRQTQYDYLWVIAATCLATGVATGIVIPCLDTEMINLFLGKFARQLTPDIHALLIWDGANFPMSKSLKVLTNVTLIQLPPYSPELNPIENLWHYLRSHHWSNRSYKNWEALKEAACPGLIIVGRDAARVKTVCAAPYISKMESAVII